MSKQTERTYKPTEVASIMNLSALRIRRLCQEGKLGAIKKDGQWIIPETALKAELERRVAKATNYADMLKAL